MKKFTLDRDLIIVDVETSGTLPTTSSVIQIGAYKFNKHGKLVNEKFNIYIKPYKPEWSLTAEKIHKLTPEFLDKNGVYVKIGIDKFANWANRVSKRYYIAQWSCGFDTSMLKSAFEFCNEEYPFSYRSYDVASIVRFHLASKGKKPEGLIRCARFLKVDTTGIVEHNAEHDAKLAGLCLQSVINAI